MQPLHEKHRYSGLNICLELGGYYLKAGQMVVGMQLLPKQMEEELQVCIIVLAPCPTPLCFVEIGSEFNPKHAYMRMLYRLCKTTCHRDLSPRFAPLSKRNLVVRLKKCESSS